jgi:hypothetical protein
MEPPSSDPKGTEQPDRLAPQYRLRLANRRKNLKKQADEASIEAGRIKKRAENNLVPVEGVGGTMYVPDPELKQAEQKKLDDRREAEMQLERMDQVYEGEKMADVGEEDTPEDKEFDRKFRQKLVESLRKQEQNLRNKISEARGTEKKVHPRTGMTYEVEGDLDEEGKKLEREADKLRQRRLNLVQEQEDESKEGTTFLGRAGDQFQKSWLNFKNTVNNISNYSSANRLEMFERIDSGDAPQSLVNSVPTLREYEQADPEKKEQMKDELIQQMSDNTAQIIENREKSAELYENPMTKAMVEADSFEEGFDAFMRNPLDAITGLSAESSMQMVPGVTLGALGAATGNPAAAASGFMIGSGSVEFGASLGEGVLNEASKDSRTQQYLNQKLSDAGVLGEDEDGMQQFQNLKEYQEDVVGSLPDMPQDIKQSIFDDLRDNGLVASETVDGQQVERFAGKPEELLQTIGSNERAREYLANNLPSGKYGGINTGDVKNNLQRAQQMGEVISESVKDKESVLHDKVMNVLQDDEVMSDIAQRSAIRGGVIGTVEGLSATIPGAAIAKQIGRSRAISRALGNAGKMSLSDKARVGGALGLGVMGDAAGGGLGEAGAQVATGEEVKAGEVLAEAAPELISGPFDIATVAKGLTTENLTQSEQEVVDQIRKQREQLNVPFRSPVNRPVQQVESDVEISGDLTPEENIQRLEDERQRLHRLRNQAEQDNRNVQPVQQAIEDIEERITDFAPEGYELNDLSETQQEVDETDQQTGEPEGDTQQQEETETTDEQAEVLGRQVDEENVTGDPRFFDGIAIAARDRQTGEVFVGGTSHADLISQQEENIDMGRTEMGFYTPDGRYLTREEASQYKQAGEPQQQEQAQPEEVSDVEYQPLEKESSLDEETLNMMQRADMPDAAIEQAQEPDVLVDQEGNLPESGQPIRVEAFQGTGREQQEDIYNPGADGPILGEADYFALDENTASQFGPEVNQSEVTLRNPEVISSDRELARLLMGDENAALPTTNEEVSRRMESLREKLEEQGRDGVVVNVPRIADVNRRGESAKRLREMFGNSQVIKFPTAETQRRQGRRLFAEDLSDVSATEIPVMDGQYNVRRDRSGITVTNTRTGQNVGRQSNNYNRAVAEAIVRDTENNSDFIEDENIDNEQQWLQEVSQQSNNPLEIAQAFQIAKEIENVRRESEDKAAMQQFFDQGGRIRPQDFAEYNDPVLLSDDNRLRFYTNEEATPLDQQAQELSTISGVEIEPEQIVDFLVDDYIQQERQVDQVSERLRSRFEELTGTNLTDQLAQEIEEQQFDDFTDEQGEILPEVDALIEDYIDDQGNIDYQGLWENELSEDQNKGFFTSFPGALTEQEYQRLKQEVQNEIEQRQPDQEAEAAEAETTDEQGAEQTPTEEQAEQAQPGESITVFRGTGNNFFADSPNKAFTWVATEETVARDYAGVNDDGTYQVEEMEVSKPENPFQFPYKFNTDVRASDIGGNLRSALEMAIDDGRIEERSPKISEILNKIREYEERAGNSLEKYHTKINKEGANVILREILSDLGYDAIAITERGVQTYGLFESPTEQVEIDTSSPAYGAENQIVTKDRVETARQRIREKLGGQFNAGIDPSVIKDMMEVALYHLEAGSRSFSRFASAMIDDIGENVKPYLRTLYKQAKYRSDIPNEDFSSDAEIIAWEEENLGENDLINSIDRDFRERVEEQEAQGYKDMGRPELANPVNDQQARDAVDYMDEQRKEQGKPSRRSDKSVAEEAQRRLEEDYEGEKARLFDMTQDFNAGMWSDVDVKMAKIIMGRESQEALASGNKADLFNFFLMTGIYRDVGTEQARAFRMRRDDSKSPEERRAEMTKEVFKDASQSVDIAIEIHRLAEQAQRGEITKEEFREQVRAKLDEYRSQREQNKGSIQTGIERLLGKRIRDGELNDIYESAQEGEQSIQQSINDNAGKLGLPKMSVTKLMQLEAHIENVQSAPRGVERNRALLELMEFIEESEIVGGKFSRGMRAAVDDILGRDHELFDATEDILESVRNRVMENVTQALLTPPKEIQQQMREAETDQERQEIWDDYYENYFTPIKEAIKEDMGVDIENLTEEDIKDPVLMNDILRRFQAANGNFDSKFYELWNNAILSALTTHAVNFAGTGANFFYKSVPERFFETVVNTFARDPDSAQWGELRYFWRGFFTHLPEAIKYASLAFQTETRIFAEEIGVQEGVRKFQDKTEKGVAIEGTKGRIIRALGWRPLTMMDEFFKVMAFRMQLSAEAFREAKRQGMQGEEIAEFIEAQQKNPTGQLAQAAWGWALEVAFQEEPGAITQGVADFREKHPLVKYAFPFVRTPGNLIKQGTRKGPMSFLNVIHRLGMAGAYKMGLTKDNKWTYTRTDFTQHMAETFAFWTTMGLGIVMLRGEDDDDPRPLITGSGASYRDQSAYRYEQQNYPAQSIRLPGTDRYYSYRRFDPFATMITQAVDAMNAIQDAQDGKEVTDVMNDYFEKNLRLLSDKSYFQFIGDFVRFTQYPASGLDWISNFTASFMPNIIRHAARSGDPYVRETTKGEPSGDLEDIGKGLIEKTAQKMWPASTNQPPPRVDWLGFPVQKDKLGGAKQTYLYRILSPAISVDNPPSDYDKVIMNWNNQNPNDTWHPSVPSDKMTIDGEELHLDREEYYEFAQRRGFHTQRILDEQYRKFDFEYPSEDDIQRIKSAQRKASTIAKENMLDEGIILPPIPER